MSSLVTSEMNISLKTSEEQIIAESADVVYCKSPFRNLPNEILSYIFILGYSYAFNVFRLRYQGKPPYPLVISHVCSKWRHVALNMGELWTDVGMSQFGINYNHSVFIYKIWVSRAGCYSINVMLDLTLLPVASDVHKVLQETVMPYRVRKLDITLSHRQLSQLSNLDLNIEELAITLTDFPGQKDFIAPPFLSQARYIFFRNTYWQEFDVPSATLYVLWHELRVLKCACGVALSSWLDVLRQAPLLEKCDLIICSVGTDRLEAVTLPNLRSFAIGLREVHPDTVVPFISAPKITTLEIESLDAWSADTYNITKRQYKLNRLQRLKLHPTRKFPLHVIEVLKDASMIQDLFLGGRPILNDETREKIVGGQLGRSLTQLTFHGCEDDAKEWLDVVEARQKNVCALLQTVTNWQEMFTGLRRVGFSDVKNSEAYRERVAALELLGVEVKFNV